MPTETRERPIILVAPNVRTAHLWCRDNDVSPYDRKAVRITTSPDMLRGLGAGWDFVIINPAGAVWHWRTWLKMSDYLNIITSAYKPSSYKEVWT